MPRSGQDLIDHDSMLLTRARNLEKEGYNIRADTYGKNPYPQSPTIGGKIPDIYATKGSKTIITEVETCQSYNIEDTRAQYRAFSSARNANTEFHVKVPKKCLKEAQAQARNWEITVDHWWYES